jgi:1-acyl-sn-glycerol-3-phosphate acyltransferase
MTAVTPVLRPVIRFAVACMSALISSDWRRVDRLPQHADRPGGGAIVVVNHISNVDPLVVGTFLVRNQILPRFLAKDSLFGKPVIGAILRGASQIPVHRQTMEAGDALDAAVKAIDEGAVVVIYPEGTITADPELWPMSGKTGAGRLALRTGCPVIPVGQWGAQEILYGRKRGVPRFLPRKRISMLVGEPVALDDLRHGNSGQTREATRRIMAAITELVVELRGEPVPVPYDPRPKPEGDDTR